MKTATVLKSEETFDQPQPSSSNSTAAIMRGLHASMTQPVQNRRNSITTMEKNLASLIKWLNDHCTQIPIHIITDFQDLCSSLAKAIQQLDHCASTEEIFLNGQTQASENDSSIYHNILTPLHGTLGTIPHFKKTLKSLENLISNTLAKLADINTQPLKDIHAALAAGIDKLEEHAGKQCSSLQPHLPKIRTNTPPLPGQEFWQHTVIPTPEKQIKILGVDDNELNRRILKRCFKDTKFIFDSANDAQEAIKKHCETNYDVILMDINMPAMDGISATKLIREDETSAKTGKRVAIIGISAELHRQDEAREAGMDDFLPKPFNRENILKTIATQLNSAKKIDNEDLTEEENSYPALPTVS